MTTRIAGYIVKRLQEQHLDTLFSVPAVYCAELFETAASLNMKTVVAASDIEAGYATDGYARRKASVAPGPTAADTGIHRPTRGRQCQLSGTCRPEMHTRGNPCSYRRETRVRIDRDTLQAAKVGDDVLRLRKPFVTNVLRT
jgi:hypothetical protein